MMRDPEATQAIARAISEGALRICSCGMPYTTDGDGVRRHRALYEHTPSGHDAGRPGEED